MVTPAHVDCPACPHCGLRVGVAYDRDERPLPAPTLWCPACGEQWQASAADRAQAERADAVHRLRERLTQVTGRDADDLRTVLDALARQTALATIHREERDACAAEGYRLMQALDAAQRSAAQSAAAAVDAARDLGHVVAAQTERAEAAEAQRDEAEGQCMELREAIRRQAAAVRMASTARAQMDAHDQATLRSLAGQDRAALIEETAAARRERDDWNARATTMESDRDAAVARRTALAGAVRAYLDAQHDRFDAETDPRCTRADRAMYDERYDAARAALDALLTEVGNGR